MAGVVSELGDTKWRRSRSGVRAWPWHQVEAVEEWCQSLVHRQVQAVEEWCQGLVHGQAGGGGGVVSELGPPPSPGLAMHQSLVTWPSPPVVSDLVHAPSWRGGGVVSGLGAWPSGGGGGVVSELGA